MSAEITYWYHPESESLFMHDPDSPEGMSKPEAGEGDGMLIEMDEHQYVRKIVERIEQDPNHELPPGVVGVIKRAVKWPGDSISGELFYDQHKRFADGYPINTSKVESWEPGGIACTKNNKYLVDLIQPARPAEIG